MSNSITERIRQARKFELTCGKLKLFCRRPTEVEAITINGDLPDDEALKLIAKFVDGWEGATEDMFIAGGDPESTVEFDRALLVEWMADNAKDAFYITTKVLDAYLMHKKQMEDAVKN